MGVNSKKMQQQQQRSEPETDAMTISAPLPLTRWYCTAQIFASLTVFTYATLQLGSAFLTMTRPAHLLLPLLWFIFLAPSGFLGAIQWRQARRKLAWSGVIERLPANAFFAATIFATLATVKAYIYYAMGYTMIPVTLFFYLVSLAFLFKHTHEIRKKKTPEN
jgi:hypothetical protein